MVFELDSRSYNSDSVEARDLAHTLPNLYRGLPADGECIAHPDDVQDNKAFTTVSDPPNLRLPRASVTANGVRPLINHVQDNLLGENADD